MSKRIKSKKYTGVYYRELMNGDRAFEFTYKDMQGKKKWLKVGLQSENINKVFANRKRIETINKIKLDGNEPYFCKTAVEDITKEAVEKWLKGFQKDYKQASINSYHATFKAVINYGVRKLIELERYVNPLGKISIKDQENERAQL
jgi:hypothetical protein